MRAIFRKRRRVPHGSGGRAGFRRLLRTRNMARGRSRFPRGGRVGAVEGDIIAGRAAELSARYQALLNAGRRRPRAGERVDRGFRPGAAVAQRRAALRKRPGDQGHHEDRRRYPALERADVFEDRAANGDTNYVLVTPFSDPTACASSTVGMQGGRQSPFASETCGANLLIHEIGHVIGFSHEQARSDRDKIPHVVGEHDQAGAIAVPRSVPPPTRAPTITFPSCTTAARTQQNSSATMETRLPDSHRADAGAFRRRYRCGEPVYGNAPQSITISSTPPGLQLLVDGEAWTSPAFDRAPGTTQQRKLPRRKLDDKGATNTLAGATTGMGRRPYRQA